MSNNLNLYFYPNSPIDPTGQNPYRTTDPRFAGEAFSVIYTLAAGETAIDSADTVQVLIADSETDPPLVTLAAVISGAGATISAQVLSASTLALSGGKTLMLWNATTKKMMKQDILVLHGNPLGSTDSITSFPIDVSIGGSSADLSEAIGVWIQESAGGPVTPVPLGTGLSIAGGTLHTTGGGGGGTNWGDIGGTLSGQGDLATALAAKQALDATLTALAAANWAANAIPIGTGADTLAQTPFAANTFPARGSTGNLVAKTITDTGLSLVAAASATAAAHVIGLGTADSPTWAGGTFSGNVSVSGVLSNGTTYFTAGAIVFGPYNIDASANAYLNTGTFTGLTASSATIDGVSISGGEIDLPADYVIKFPGDASGFLEMFGGSIVMGNGAITGLAAPSASTDAANKAYVDAATSGLDPKLSCRAATTANITLSGAQTVDGVSVIAGDRVLVKNQTTQANNGIYVVASGSWTRATDADASAEVTSGLFTFVTEGTLQASTGWMLATHDPITVGSTALSFTQFSGAGTYTAGSGLTLTGTQFSIGAGQVTNSMLAGSIDLAKLAGLGTGVATALAIGVGAAGAPVVNGGTATAMTLAGTTNLSGLTASRPTVIDASKNLVSISSPILEVSAAGTAYSLTNTAAALDFGTTDPTLTLSAAGTYKIRGSVTLYFNGATFAADRTVTLKLRRTNNSASDLTNATVTLHTGIVTTYTRTWQTVYFEADIYTTTNNDDAVTIFADVSTVPSAGSLQAVAARVTAERVY